MVVITNGLSQAPKWSVSFSSTDSHGTKRNRSLSGINLVAINASAEDAAAGTTNYPVNPATGYTAQEAETFVQSISTLLGETFGEASLTGKFSIY